MVSKAGEWSLSSDTINGISFAGSGTFQDTGKALIALNALGTPLKPGNFFYSLTQGTFKLFISVTVLKSNVLFDTVPLESYFKATIGGINYYSKAATIGPENVTYGRGGAEKVS